MDVHMHGIEYGESKFPKCEAGLPSPSSNLEPTPKSSYKEQFDKAEKQKDVEQDARIKEYYLNQYYLNQ